MANLRDHLAERGDAGARADVGLLTHPQLSAMLASTARLAAAACGARRVALMAVDAVGLRCVASFGFDEAGLACALELCDAVQAGAGTGVLAEDGWLISAAHAEGGAVVGLLCACDGPPGGFGREAAGALDDAAASVASVLALYARARCAEARAEGMDLRGAILSAAAAADGVASALDAVMEVVCARADAVLCHLWHCIGGTRRYRMLGGVARAALTGSDFVQFCSDLEIDLADTRLGVGLAEARQVVTPGICDEDGAHAELQALSLRYGLASRIATPLQVGPDAYVLVLCFDRRQEALGEMAEMVAGATAPLAPILQRLQERQRADLFQRIVEASGDAVLVTEAEPFGGPEPCITYANPAFERLTGAAAEEIVGRPTAGLDAQGGDAVAFVAARLALVGGASVREEFTCRARHGGEMTVEMQTAALADAVGGHTHYVALLRDMTEKRRAVQEGERREAAFRQLFEANPVPMWLCDRRTLRFLEVNDAATSVYGWSRAQFLAMTILDIRPPEEQEPVRRAVEKLSGKRNESGPWRHLYADGQERLVHITCSPLRFQSVPAILVAAFDITERVRAEQALRRSESMLTHSAADLRQTMHLAGIGTWRRPKGARLVQWSDDLYPIFGRTRSEFLPERDAIRACVHPEDRERMGRLIDATEAGEGPCSFDFRVVRPDGGIAYCWTEVRLEEDPLLGGLHVRGLCQDVTERHLSAQALLRAEKLGTIGQMTGGIAHDFNNLLTVISISLELAEELVDEPGGLPPLLKAARDAADKGAQLTAQLLSYARRQPLRPIAISPAVFVADLSEMLSRVLGERHRVETHLAPNTPAFLADPAQLETAMLNLFLNARDAMPNGGQIRLEVTEITFTESYATSLDEVQPGRYAMIAVVDRGEGMTAQTLARAFEPFFTTKPLGKGTGLGLSMVMGFAKQSGGHVSVYSEPGQGAVVKLFLPLGTAHAPAGGGPGASLAPVTRKLPPLDVLVVEDKDEVRDVACRMCVDLGLRPTPASSAEEALAYLSAGLRFGLLFTDVVLAGAMNGPELAGKALALQPDLPVLFASGYTENTILRPDRLDEPGRLLSKPYSKAQFIEAVGAVLKDGAAAG